jgi:hypothetical protein
VDRDGRFFFVEEMGLRPVGLGQERGGEIIRWTSRRASLFGGPAARDNFVSASKSRDEHAKAWIVRVEVPKISP